ncbi:UNC-like C-terminal-domain-containing protein [Spinellus fusiger]|nr:UNC-like C-terminal-domain-containing protein [Spinellus fusiger]
MEAFSAHPHTALSTPQVNTVDYALATAGAQVIQRLTHKTHTHYPRTTPLKQLSRLTGLWSHQAYSAEAALMPGNEPGQCWTMEGTQGTLGIHLSQPIVIENITMEYNLNIHPTHAPRMFQVWGFKSLKDITSGRVFSFEWPWVKSNPGAVLLGTFEYQLNGPMSQAFEVSSSRYFIAHVVLVRVMSNWGNEASTSLYRLKVHGVPEERS